MMSWKGSERKQSLDRALPRNLSGQTGCVEKLYNEYKQLREHLLGPCQDTVKTLKIGPDGTRNRDLLCWRGPSAI
jgi:hypothetical protein